MIKNIKRLKNRESPEQSKESSIKKGKMDGSA